jgi:hypothetical protein
MSGLKEKIRKYKWNMQDLWDTNKRPNLKIMGIEKKRGGAI